MATKANDEAAGVPARPLIELLREAPVEGSSWRGRPRAEQIVDVAMENFQRKGYSATSMDDIAQAVGILKGSIYHYIDSKDDLLFLMVSKVRDDVDLLTTVALDRRDLSPLDRLVHYVDLQVHYNARNLTRIAVYHHEWRRLEGDYLTEIKARRAAAAARLREVLVQAQGAGEIAADLDLDLALRTSLGVPSWVYTWYDPGLSINADELATFCSEYVRRALSA